MKQKTSSEDLNDAILMLQKKQSEELLLLRQQFHITFQSLKPINLIKSTLQEITQAPEIKNTIAKNLIGLTTGYLAKKVLVGATAGPINSLIGMVLQFAVTNIVSKNSEGIKTKGKNFLRRIFKFKDVKKEQLH